MYTVSSWEGSLPDPDELADTSHGVHYGRASQILERRERTLRLAWNQHPERFVNGTPKPQPLPHEVWINPPAAAATARPAQ